LGAPDTPGNRSTILSLVALRLFRWGATLRQEPELRPNTPNAHTPVMTLKNAALLALIGTMMVTILLVWSFVFTFLNVLRDLAPAVTLFSSLHRAQ
jgi:hypothetical protein